MFDASSAYCIFYVLFNPQRVDIDNILNISKESGFKVIIYNNSVNSEALEKIRSQNIAVLGDGRNIGLSRAYNILSKYALSRGFLYSLILDQDTYLPPFTISSIFEKSANYPSALGSFFTEGKISSLSHIFINSGFCLNLLNLKSINYYDESYFVEGVDFSLGLKALVHDLAVNKFPLSTIDHKSLQSKNYFHFFGFAFQFRLYKPRRLFEMYYSWFRLIKFCLVHRIPIGYIFYLLKLSVSTFPRFLFSLLLYSRA